MWVAACCSRAYQSASARIRRPSASGFVTSTVRPEAVRITSEGRIASGADHVLAGREHAEARRAGGSSSAIAPSAASTAAPPPMSPFWRTMSDCGLRK